MEEFTHLGGRFIYTPTPPHSTTTPSFTHITPYNPNPNQQQPTTSSSADPNMEVMKAKIVSHPRYSILLTAYLDCHNLGAPPDAAARLSSAAQDVEARQRSATASTSHFPPDPELDQFMEAYCDMLVKYREELTRPINEAMDFMKRVESQLNSLTDGAAPLNVFPSSTGTFAAEKYEGVSSSEDQDGSGGEAEVSEIDSNAEDRELKHHLLKKYSGYLSSLRHELSKKKKKGNLPKDARQKLLNWWEMHYKWPYPSETEKVALAESSGLDQKQINNWFINQRKRHWKPSEDMRFVAMNGFHQQNAAALCMEGQFMGDGTYRLGP